MMPDLTNFSCDKCAREGSRHCKRCYHTDYREPTRFKRKKKKTDCITPEFRKPTPPPQPVKFEDMDPDKQWKMSIWTVCSKVSSQADDVVKVINESGFEKPVVVIKLFSDHTVSVYVNEEDEEDN